MFSKQVWHDRKHQAEVFVNGEGMVSGTILSYKRGVCLVNPRPEVLVALYQEAKIKRILGVNAVVLTDHSPEFVRGLCTLIAYSRELRRRKPLTVYVRADGVISPVFLNSCCAQLMRERTQFELNIVPVPVAIPFGVGEASLRYMLPENSPHPRRSRPYLELRTGDRAIHYYDESYAGEMTDYAIGGEAPDIAIRAVQLPQYRQIIPAKREIAKV